MCGIQTKVLNLKGRIQLFEFGKRNNATNTVMSLCIKETDRKGQVSLILPNVAGKHVEGVSEKINIPSPIKHPEQKNGVDRNSRGNRFLHSYKLCTHGEF